DLLYRLLSPEILQTELDLCWVNVGGENPSDFLRKYTDRAPVVHLKDFVMKNRGRKEGLYELIGIKPTDVQADEGDFAFRPIGQGVQDVKDIFKAAKDANSQWIVVEQDRECLGLSSLVCVEQSINYIKKIQQ
ncbi:MAG: sugar phosphate isomerase/epimerase, partial [Clostridia bacterium]